MNTVKHRDCWGVPLAKPRVALSAKTRADYRAVGFPLQSLTQGSMKIDAPLIRMNDI